jgi:hypothetical protein
MLTVDGEHTGKGFTTTTEGAFGMAGIVTAAEAEELQPAEFLTMNEYVPGINPLTVADPPEPEIFTPAGMLVIVQPPPGNPERTTRPSGKAQVGSVIVPGTGGWGVTGCGFITMLDDNGDVHPPVPATVKLYVPEGSVTVVLVPVPVVVTVPG